MYIRNYLTLLLFLFACKGDDITSTSNIVKVRLEGTVDQINPMRTNIGYTKQVESQLFMPLLQFDSETLDLYPVLARTRPLIEPIDSGEYEGGRKLTFEIRPEAEWDNGDPVTANDVDFTFKTMFHPEIGAVGLQGFYSFVKEINIEPANPKHFSLIIDRPFLLAEAAIGTMPIYPKHQYDPDKILDGYHSNQFLKEKIDIDSALSKFATQFNALGYPQTFDRTGGCGAYQIVEWEDGERLILEKKQNWWGNQIIEAHQSFKALPDQLTYQFVESDVTLSTLLKEKKIDVSGSVEPVIFEELKSSKWMQEQFNFYTPISSSYYFISMNTKNPLLNDKRVRRALAHLIDVEELIKIAVNGFAERTIGPILPSKSYYHKSLKPIENSLEKAQKLLSEAGWTDADNNGILEKSINGVSTNLSLDYKFTNSNPIAEKIGLLLKDFAARAAIEINLKPLEFRKLIEDTRRRDFDLYCSRWSLQQGPDDLRNIWHTESDTPRGLNKAGFGNANSDALIDSINITLNKNKRKELYYQIQELIYEEQPYLFLFVPQERIITNKKFDATVSKLRPGYFENTFQLSDY